MKHILKITSLFLLLFTSEALAQRFSTPFMSGSTAEVTLQAGRAYTCSDDDDGDYKLSRTVKTPTGEDITAIYPEARQEILDVHFDDAKDFGDEDLSNNVISFVTPDGAENFGTYTITMEETTEGSDTPYINCVSTSVQCSFNTSVNDFNYLEVSNNGFSTSVFSYVTKDFAGETTSGEGFVEAGKRTDVDIHSRVGASKFGSVVVHPQIYVSRYEGPGGSNGVEARLSQYSGANLTNTEVCKPLPYFFIPEESGVE